MAVIAIMALYRRGRRELPAVGERRPAYRLDRGRNWVGDGAARVEGGGVENLKNEGSRGVKSPLEVGRRTILFMSSPRSEI